MTNKIKNILVTILFFSIIIGFFLGNIIKKDEKISVAERRKLTSFPEFSVSNLLNGTFFSKFDSYVTDQFVEREKFRKLKVETELNVFRKNDYNKLYEYNGYLIENLYPLNEKSVSNVVNKINQIKDNYLISNNNVYFTIIPDKNYFVDDGNLKLDYTKLENIMKNGVKNATYIDIKSELKLEDYYKTDSHWKQENIVKIAKKITENIKNDNTQDYMLQTINTKNYASETLANFRGTYSGRIPLAVDDDKITILTNEEIKNAKVFYADDNKEGQVYDLSKLNSLDKYDVYLSGAKALITIENESAESDKELVMFRDSYGSSLAPLLISEYKKITVVDTRYISPKLLSNYIEFKNQDILFAYSAILINNSTSLK